MPIKNFEELVAMTKKAQKQTLVVAAAHDEHALQAVMEAYELGLIDYFLVGDRDRILQLSQQIGFDVSPESIIHCADDRGCAKKAVELAGNGQAQAIMKGKLQTAELLKEVVNKETGIGMGGTMSHVGLFELPEYHKLLAITDGGMILTPDLFQKKAIIENAVGFLKALGYDCPKVAVLCPVETVNPKILATVDAAQLKEMNKKGEIAGCMIEGPISFDLMISKESANIKQYSSPVTGAADILLTPDMTCGNILGKTLVYTAGAVMGGCIIGAKVPIILTSRGATAKEKLYSIVMAVVSQTS